MNLLTSEFRLMGNGKVAVAVWANPSTKEVYPANRTPWNFNAPHSLDGFYAKYGKGLRLSQGKGNYRAFYYSAAQMRALGFQLVKRGESPLW